MTKRSIDYPYRVTLSSADNANLERAAAKVGISPQRYLSAVFADLVPNKLGKVKIQVKGDSRDAMGLLVGKVFLLSHYPVQSSDRSRAGDLANPNLCPATEGSERNAPTGGGSGEAPEGRDGGLDKIEPIGETRSAPSQAAAPAANGRETKNSHKTQLKKLSRTAQKIYDHLCEISAGKKIAIRQVNLARKFSMSAANVSMRIKDLRVLGLIYYNGKKGQASCLIAPYDGGNS